RTLCRGPACGSDRGEDRGHRRRDLRPADAARARRRPVRGEARRRPSQDRRRAVVGAARAVLRGGDHRAGGSHHALHRVRPPQHDPRHRSGGRMRAIVRVLSLTVVAVVLPAPSSHAAHIDPTARDFKTPAQIQWVRNAAGTNESAVLFGDPSKPGPYVVRVKWLPGNMSRAHFHPNDRFFVVLSGTWWMGTGEKFDPESTVPAPAGSYVIHYGGKVHYDGAKTEETIIQVWGMGPATSTPAEKK